ncbi:DNA repair protein RadA [Muribaculaceae bacterium Isolate-113 (HZI)]|jgi:DNA repair protein RadA/Sms|uniref:DNA repair protein RadA n=1 Tax=Bacteroidales TaxID=171549 RepID=UPI000E8A4FB4|nr:MULTISPECIES: DNA repair protein RadA [Bacteroidales]MBJ2193548.1 DNA repair protein RadA [Muribaculaceae bacterium]ROT18145.1 DNA repair protein RadA [Muribaculaceae bacterium Isolate-114 (HZI)]ROT18986.1 DNA repair protein RadA [Muribaculaceae bacterium Isolate-113 (HZI)]RXE66535.1 DNA repair protein RadA [Muribaculaceae bacterium Isolate-001 (NCI)]HBY15661.1 DNA repair protein RadA [Porphyromonadaceae bacterium]
MASAKTKSVYFCSDCGYESPKWLGKCPGCGEWNTFVEEKVSAKPGKSARKGLVRSSTPVRLSEIEVKEEMRVKMPSSELNRVLGGGLVAGSLTLIGGEPGIGKSTLLLQNILSIRNRRILYVSGEESASQLKLRADRLGKISEDTFILCETNLDNIFTQIENVSPSLIVVDSIQTICSSEIESAAGSVSQVRECAASLLRYAKESGVPVILVGHINKDGAIAGPKVLEHIVDTVLQFEGDRQYLYRILRSIKNRFGSTNEIGIYEMAQKGLKEVKNPSEMLLSENRDEEMSGIAIGVTMEGIRPFMVEVQALVSSAAYGTPQRSVTGFDQRRLNMLLAVLEKRAKFKLSQKDVFLNIAGGLKVADPALDMAVVAAIMSSNFDISIERKWAFAGEVGLSGEIRTVTRIEQRVSEAQKLGFESILIPKGNLKGIKDTFNINIVEVGKVEEVFKNIFG